MRHLALALAALAPLSSGAVAADADCSGSMVPQPLPVRPSGLPPVANELSGVGSQIGAPAGVLAMRSNESQSVDRVLLRLRIEGCQNVAAASQAQAPGNGGYQPRTQYDNTPYRFNAESGFSAAEFDAWMKSRGIRISTGQPRTAETVRAERAAAAAAAAGTCQQQAGNATSC